MIRTALIPFLAAATLAIAAPYVPRDDAAVLERLPVRPSDPIASELRRLRAQAASTPSDPASAVRLARRDFELAVSQGDPRYVGYADAALRQWYPSAAMHAGVLTVRGLLRQYRHDFEGALAALAAREPAAAGPALAWLESSGFESAKLRRIAGELKALAQ